MKIIGAVSNSKWGWGKESLKKMLRLLLALQVFVTLTSTELTLSEEASSTFLREHNRLRADAVPMSPLQWSEGLAHYAASRANLCIYQHDPARRYGENLYRTSRTVDDVTGAGAASEAWGAELHDVDSQWACAYGRTSRTCGHYSQQVWRTTSHVGCAVRRCAGGTLVVCEYSPRGNVMGYDRTTGRLVFTPPY
ncbi:pathogenesis-related protein PR-1 type-like [Aplysia californica]|uniref:Pathogenesis-related protein PR-1 type-like n=1 Tax=Aplysia californica TaxID=6500 RepID=A0ABM0K3D4_APLCA|nr:pathogenesis-related protein PR-1 type-like [Aplysia californica]